MVDVNNITQRIRANDIQFSCLIEALRTPTVRDFDSSDIQELFKSLWSRSPPLVEVIESERENRDMQVCCFWECIRLCLSIPELTGDENAKGQVTLIDSSNTFKNSFGLQDIKYILEATLQIACTEPPRYNARGGGVVVARHAVTMLHWLYENRPDLRSTARKKLSAALLALGAHGGYRKDAGAGPCRQHVQPLLECLLSIIKGLKSETDVQYCCKLGLLKDVLIPLHAPSEMVEWRTQVPVLQAYHPVLVQCVLALISTDTIPGGSGNTVTETESIPIMQHQLKRPSLVGVAILGVLSAQVWPDSIHANHVKELLLLTELEILLLAVRPGEVLDSDVHAALLSRVCRSCGGPRGTEHARVIERALQLLRSDQALSLLMNTSDSKSSDSKSSDSKSTDTETLTVSSSQSSSDAVAALVRALYRDGRPSWNPSVNRMTVATLRRLKSIDPNAFGRALSVDSGTTVNGTTSYPIVLSAQTLKREAQSDSTTSLSPRNLSTIPAPPAVSSLMPIPMPLSMSNRLPPRPNCSSRMVPFPYTGAAARLNPQGLGHPHAMSSDPHYSMTVTGVAPWATVSTAALPRPSAQPSSTLPQPSISAHNLVASFSETKLSTGLCATVTSAALTSAEVDNGERDQQRLERYISACVDAIRDDGVSEDLGEKKKDDALQSSSPCLLPGLKFFDLVFGHELGKGAFSVVRYAKLIDRDQERQRTRPASEWPEYAVKIVSAEQIARNGYAANVEREMAVLRLLTHPGVARLVSAFRYRQSAYMVLEYASGGDLHTRVMRRGALGTLEARFILGEVSAALVSVHALGLAYVDLKPENVLLTASGHAKLTDFGGARAVNPQGEDMLRASRGLLKNLRCGDWKEGHNEELKDDVLDLDADDSSGTSEFVDDDRIEGTPAYLAPELLVMTVESLPSSLAVMLSERVDAWSLGCLTHFCLNGRPLFFGGAEDVCRQMIEREQMREHANDWSGNGAVGLGRRKVRFASEVDNTGATADINISDSFVDLLLQRDPDARMSVRQAMSHAFLTTGGDNNGDFRCFVAFDPVSLHSSTPPASLISSDPLLTPATAGETDPPEEWKRRQLSRLIAPMPRAADYALNSNTIGYHGLFQGIAGLVPYTLTVISETEVEIGAKFA